jgi:hypothetical protein
MRNQSTLSLSEIRQKFSAAGLFIKDSSDGLSGECPCLENHPTRAGRKRPNLSIKLGSNGEVLTHCFGGCAQGVVFKKTLEVLGDRDGSGPKTPKAPSWKPIVVEQKIEKPDPEKDFTEDWETLHDLPNGSDDHDYLKRKNAKSYGLKKDENGNLVVPIYFYEQGEEPSLIGLQLIDKEGAKKTARKSKMKGGAYLLDTPIDNYPIYLCEGYATAATVGEATFGSAGTCFGITQMLNSARVLQRAYPKSEVICLPDAGVKQETIEELIKEGFRVIQPDFSTYRPQEGEKVPTDYNDLAHLASEKGSDIIKGYEAVVRQLDAALMKPKPKSQMETFFAPFLEPYSWEQFLHDLTHTPESVDSGFMLKRKPLLYPSGAISIIAGATGHGKTAVLIQSLVNYLLNEKYKEKTALFLTLEEQAKAVNVKILVNMLGDSTDIKSQDLPRVHLKQAMTERRTIPDLDSHRETLSRLRLVPKFERIDVITTGINEAIRRAEGSIGAVFIDYAQLLEGSGGERTRQEELKGICISMKDLAVETGLPFVIGAQFNRNVISPLEVHPTNLGEAGDLERIASLLVGIWNGDKKAKADKAGLNTLKNEPYKIGDDGTRKGEMYFEILKNREGESGTNDWLRWHGPTGHISNKKGEEGNGLILEGSLHR